MTEHVTVVWNRVVTDDIFTNPYKFNQDHLELLSPSHEVEEDM